MRAVTRTSVVVSVLVAGTCAGAVPGFAAETAPAYRAVTLGTLGGLSSVPAGMNDRGEVVGWANTVDGGLHPFRWEHGRMTDLGTLDDVDGGRGIAAGVNRYGTVVGQSDRGGVTRAVSWQHGRIRELGTLGGPSSFATAINDHGVIVGGSTTADGTLHAFVWRDGRMTDLGVPGGGDSVAEDVNNRGEVVGFAMPADAPAFPYLWRDGDVTVLPSSPYGGQARAINDDGVIAGWASGSDANQAVCWRLGRVVALGTLPGGDASMAWDVNDHGVVLGTGNVQPQMLDDHAFLWSRGVFRDLYADGVPSSVVALDNRGDVVATVPAPGGEGRVAALFLRAAA